MTSIMTTLRTLLVDDPVVGTPLYEQLIDNTDEERDAQYNY